MIGCTEWYRDRGVDITERTIFSGKSCFPLSPNDQGLDDDSEDQLSIILNTYGELKTDDVSFITSNQAMLYVEDMVDFENCKIDFS